MNPYSLVGIAIEPLQELQAPSYLFKSSRTFFGEKEATGNSICKIENGDLAGKGPSFHFLALSYI